MAARKVIHCRGNLGSGNHRRWGDQDVVAAVRRQRTLDGINQESAIDCRRGYSTAKFSSTGKGAFVDLSKTNSTAQSRPIPRTSPTEFRILSCSSFSFSVDATLPARLNRRPPIGSYPSCNSEPRGRRPVKWGGCCK